MACAAIAVASQAVADLGSARNQETRDKDLTVTAQNVMAQRCWEVKGQEKFTIGELIEVNGKSPTSCFINRQTNEYGHAAYLQGKLQVTNVFSQKEVNAKTSYLLEGGKK